MTNKTKGPSRRRSPAAPAAQKPPGQSGPPGKGTTAFKVGGRTYERRRVYCGKDNCSKCNGQEHPAPGHGPYWYLCISVHKRWRRIYLGKDLDTTRFVCPDGTIDWKAVYARRNRRVPKEIAEHLNIPGMAVGKTEAPGQLDAFTDHSPPSPSSAPDPDDPGPVPPVRGTCP